ncbi:MAG: ABC transporter ATP-binding protein [Desulfofustis sp.]|nr:ABC transporter ATP-binding protein [Desulfofustis sp.]
MHDFGYMEKGRQASLSDVRLWQRILRHSRGFRRAIGIAVILSLGVTGATLALPYLLKSGVDSYITATQLPDALRISGLADTALQFGLLVVIGFLLTFVQVVLLEWVGQSVMHRIRQDLFAHILDLDLAFLNRQPTGRLVTRLTNDVQNMHEMFTSVLVTLFNDILRLAGILVVLLLINFRLGLVMSLFIPIALLLTVVFARLAREKFRAIRSQLSRLNSFTQEAVSGITIIQLFGRQRRAAERFAALSEEYLTRTLSQIRLFGAFMPLTELLSSAAIALILWYGGAQVIGRTLTIGEMVAFLAYMRLFFQPLRELSQKYSIVQSALASAERIFATLDTKAALTDPAEPRRLTDIDGRLSFRNLSFSYEPDQPVLVDFDLKINPGETVAVVGTTGSGKSTLINLLLRFYQPQGGTIEIDDVNIAELRVRDLRRIVGVILQDVFILKDTLLANIVMDTGCSRQHVESILEQTGMTRFVAKLPAELDTMLGEGGRDLSTGEKQLLSFARVMCRNPAILVLDEATASIDSETESILEEAIARSFIGRTSIIIAHRLSTIRRADRIVVMDNGRIVEQGTHEILFEKNGHYAGLLRLDLLDQPLPQGRE